MSPTVECSTITSAHIRVSEVAQEAVGDANEVECDPLSDI
jgi:hypothetical protein